ncbi:MAG: hypothetical protein L0Y72_07145 [Gemmataceae bacterium]|nr:hypothetical protein [Gemmataceae bacterium]MCI0738802.1 hypothetical protein [Gemmataceae bacterium]
MDEKAINSDMKAAELPLRQIDAELRLRYDEIKKALSRLEEAKAVSQETLQLEVSV